MTNYQILISDTNRDLYVTALRALLTLNAAPNNNLPAETREEIEMHIGMLTDAVPESEGLNDFNA